MRKIDYDVKDSENTATIIATDKAMNKKFGNIQRAYEEGFAASDGVRAGTAETNGRVRSPEKIDEAPSRSTANTIADENPGLADN